MRHHGSYDKYDEIFMDFKEKIYRISNSPFFRENFQSKEIVISTKRILASDIFDSNTFSNNHKELNQSDEVFENLLNYIKNLPKIEKTWNDCFFWLLNNTFIFFWFDSIQIFQSTIQKEIKILLRQIWVQIQNQILKWNTDFPTEFTLGTSFLIFEDKHKILDYLLILKHNFTNTIFSQFINNLIEFISLGSLPIDTLRIPQQSRELEYSLSLLIMKFGKIDDFKKVNIMMNSILESTWNQISAKENKLIKGASIRDWLISKYIELLVIKELEMDFNIQIPELPFFSLSPREFERLIYWIFKSDIKWRNVEWRGAAGSEEGKDILAIKKDSDKNWIIQAKRDKAFSRSNLINEFSKVRSELKKYDSEGYIICIAKNASDDLRKAAEELMEESKYNLEIKDSEDLNFIVKNSPILLKEFFKIRFS